MTLRDYLNGIIGLKTFYRIVPIQGGIYYKYTISKWSWYFPFWTHSPYHGFFNKEDAEEYLVELQEAEVYYTL